jgi:recombination protein RecT
MTTEIAKVTPTSLIESAKDKFIQIIGTDKTVKYEKESMFAFQALTKSDYIYGVAMQNPNSVINAVINIASVGLSLNPATSYAFLVPRDKAICLDISYQGLIKIATDSGSIMWAKADLVYSNDKFDYHGPAKIPSHTADPFSKNRGEFAGVYCIAKTRDGDYLIETMSAEEINNIKNESSSIKSAKTTWAKEQSPWNRYFGEMAKKTCIKRASKTWPKTDRSERIQTAIDVIHEHEGSEWGETEPQTMSGKPLDHEAVTIATDYFIHEINMDEDEEIVAPRIKEKYNSLTQDEQIAVNNRLKDHKFGKRQMNTILKGFLDLETTMDEL